MGYQLFNNMNYNSSKKNYKAPKWYVITFTVVTVVWIIASLCSVVFPTPTPMLIIMLTYFAFAIVMVIWIAIDYNKQINNNHENKNIISRNNTSYEMSEDERYLTNKKNRIIKKSREFGEDYSTFIKNFNSQISNIISDKQKNNDLYQLLVPHVDELELFINNLPQKNKTSIFNAIVIANEIMNISNNNKASFDMTIDLLYKLDLLKIANAFTDVELEYIKEQINDSIFDKMLDELTYVLVGKEKYENILDYSNYYNVFQDYSKYKTVDLFSSKFNKKKMSTKEKFLLRIETDLTNAVNSDCINIDSLIENVNKKDAKHPSINDEDDWYLEDDELEDDDWDYDDEDETSEEDLFDECVTQRNNFYHLIYLAFQFLKQIKVLDVIAQNSDFKKFAQNAINTYGISTDCVISALSSFNEYISNSPLKNINELECYGIINLIDNQKNLDYLHLCNNYNDINFDSSNVAKIVNQINNDIGQYYGDIDNIYKCILAYNLNKGNTKVIKELILRQNDYNEKIKAAKNKYKLLNKQNSYSIVDIDMMSGFEFEKFLGTLFKQLGYKTIVTQASNDYGVDVIIEKDGIKIAVQAKRYTEKNVVGISAIQEAVAGKNHYKTDRAMVITNSTFTKNAKILASENNVILWDRNELKKKLNEIV